MNQKSKFFAALREGLFGSRATAPPQDFGSLATAPPPDV